MTTPSGGWGKPSVGGTALRIPAINSPNFNLVNPLSSPSPSWAILQSGIAYFFGLVLSGGTITGPDYIINTAGAFFYSGSPALGNLIVSIAGAAGVDGFGNVFPQGINVTKGQFSGSNYVINSLGFFLYSGTPALGNLVASVTAASGADDGLGNTFKADVTVYGTSGTYVQMLASGIAALNVGSGDAAETTPAKLTSGIFGSGGPRFIQTILSSARVSGQNALSNLQMILEGESVDHSFGNDLRIEGSSQTGAEGFRIALEAVDGSSSMLFAGTGVAGNMLNLDVTNNAITLGARNTSSITAVNSGVTSTLASTRVSAAGQTVSSLAPTFVSLTGLLLLLDPGKWQIRIRVFINANANAGQWQLQITVPAGTTGNYSFKWESAAGVSGLNVNRSSFATALGGPSPSVAGAYWATIEGVVTLTAGGSINVKGATTIAADTFDVESASYFEAFPVL